MDTWDPIIVNPHAQTRPIILLDFPGVGHSTGKVSSSLAAMATEVITFLSLTKVSEVDFPGFSIGGYVAQMVSLNGLVGLVCKLFIASAGPSVGLDTIARQVLPERKAASAGTLTLDDFLVPFFPRSTETSIQASKQWWARIYERNHATSREERSDWLSDGLLKFYHHKRLAKTPVLSSSNHQLFINIRS